MAALFLFSMSACSSNEESSSTKRLTVAASFYPIEEIVRALAGEQVEVLGLEDTFAVTVGLEKQAKSGIAEALAPQIVS
jgi:uncharacterized lipoprotein YmbA